MRASPHCNSTATDGAAAGRTLARGGGAAAETENRITNMTAFPQILRRNLMNRRAVILAAPTLALAAGPTRAQTWPARPVRFVVGFSAGGANDIMARLLAAKLN